MSIVKKILLLGVFLLGFIYQGNSQKNSIGLLVEQVIPSSFEISGDVNQGFYVRIPGVILSSGKCIRYICIL